MAYREPWSSRRPEHYRDRGDRRRHLTGRFQFAGGCVDPELHDGIRRLVGDVEPGPTRVDGKIARKGHTLRSISDDGEQVGGGIDAVSDDAVVAAVRDIEELARRVHDDLRRA